MRNNILKNVVILLILAALIISLAFIPFEIPVTYCDSELNETWYYGASGLNIQSAIQTVSGWDLSKLDKNDPVVIAVIDTGIYQEHEVFDGVLLKNEAGTMIKGYNSYQNENGESTNQINDISPEYHGTEVASVIAMLIHEFGIEDYIKIIPIRACSEAGTSFPLDSISNALEYCAKSTTIDIVNLSLGLQSSADGGAKWGTDTRLIKAIDALKKDKVIIEAAGNNSKDSASNPYYPAALDGIFSVMGYGSNGSIYTTSNYGDEYELAAPGESILTGYRGNGVSAYRNQNGTSFAAPIVSFTAALLKIRLQLSNINPTAYAITNVLTNINYPSTTTKDTYSIKKLDLKTIVDGNIDSKTYTYELPTAIKLTNDGTLGEGDYEDYLFLKLSDQASINFEASILPYRKIDPDLNGLLTWVEIDKEGNETVLGKGTSLTYTPNKGGVYTVAVRLTYNGTFESKEQVYIQYGQYYVQNVKVTFADQVSKGKDGAPSEGTAYVNDTVRFSLTGIEYVDQTVEIKWYVDNEYVGSGVVFEYKLQSEGLHTILAKYGDRGIVDDMAFTINVKPESARPANIAIICVCCLAVAAIGIAVSCIILKKRKFKMTYDTDVYKIN